MNRVEINGEAYNQFTSRHGNFLNGILVITDCENPPILLLVFICTTTASKAKLGIVLKCAVLHLKHEITSFGIETRHFEGSNLDCNVFAGNDTLAPRIFGLSILLKLKALKLKASRSFPSNYNTNQLIYSKMPKTACRHCGKEYVNVREHITKTHSWVSMPGDYYDYNWELYWLDRVWKSEGSHSVDSEGDTESIACFYYNDERSEEMMLTLFYLKNKSKITKIAIEKFNPKNGDWSTFKNTINPKIAIRV